MMYSIVCTYTIHHIILFVKIPGSKAFGPSILSIIKKNPACRILRLRRVALATLFHSAAVRSLAELFLCHRTKFPMTRKKLLWFFCQKSSALFPLQRFDWLQYNTRPLICQTIFQKTQRFILILFFYANYLFYLLVFAMNFY